MTVKTLLVENALPFYKAHILKTGLFLMGGGRDRWGFARERNNKAMIGYVKGQSILNLTADKSDHSRNKQSRCGLRLHWPNPKPQMNDVTSVNRQFAAKSLSKECTHGHMFALFQRSSLNQTRKSLHNCVVVCIVLVDSKWSGQLSCNYILAR